MKFFKAPEDMLIYDESDDLLFRDPKAFDDFTKENLCICFTATPGGDEGNLELEDQVIRHLGIKVI